MQITKNTVAAIDYTISDTQGKVLDSSKGRDPMTYLHGLGSIVPGIERALEGKSVGETIKIVLPPEDGYGNKDPNMVQPVPRENFQGIDEIKVGMQFHAQTPNGARVVTVVDVDDQNVTVDANHPLAGITLAVEATVVDVRAASEDELSHGHACHGQCGNPDCQ